MTARIKRSLPSTMSSAPILSNFTCKGYKKIESTESPLRRLRRLTPMLKRLDFKTNSPYEYHKKCMENNVENLHVDISE